MSADVHNLMARKNIGAAKGLLQSLVPRAQCFCFYDLSRDCVWSSDGADDHEIDNYVADLPDEILTDIGIERGQIHLVAKLSAEHPGVDIRSLIERHLR